MGGTNLCRCWFVFANQQLGTLLSAANFTKTQLSFFSKFVGHFHTRIQLQVALSQKLPQVPLLTCDNLTIEKI